MGDDRPRTAREHRRKESTALVDRLVAHGVDAAMQTMEATNLRAVCGGAIAQAQIPHLFD
jgi:hypothetical protein